MDGCSIFAAVEVAGYMTFQLLRWLVAAAEMSAGNEVA